MFDYLVNTPSDINEHLPTLKELASECNSVLELGVRTGVSTWAFIEGLPQGAKLISVDIETPDFYNGSLATIQQGAELNGIDFEFIKKDSVKVKTGKVDLLFVDTLHTYEQVNAELKAHSKNVNKYIVFHDTVSCPEILPAIKELKGFTEHAHYTNNNGLLILKKDVSNTNI
jgi:cephalosporin hydroxylase